MDKNHALIVTAEQNDLATVQWLFQTRATIMARRRSSRVRRLIRNGTSSCWNREKPSIRHERRIIRSTYLPVAPQATHHDRHLRRGLPPISNQVGVSTRVASPGRAKANLEVECDTALRFPIRRTFGESEHRLWPHETIRSSIWRGYGLAVRLVGKSDSENETFLIPGAIPDPTRPHRGVPTQDSLARTITDGHAPHVPNRNIATALGLSDKKLAAYNNLTMVKR